MNLGLGHHLASPTDQERMPLAFDNRPIYLALTHLFPTALLKVSKKNKNTWQHLNV
jgi:hypothetical protein